jgi:miniconductance mechanosensitive channel
MVGFIENWFSAQGLSGEQVELVVDSLNLLLLLAACWLSYLVAKVYEKRFFRHVFQVTDHSLFHQFKNHHVWSRTAQLVPGLVLLFFVERFFTFEPVALVTNAIKALMCILVARCLSAVLNVVNSVYQQQAREKYLPLNSVVQLIKLAIYLVALILAISYLLNRSPVYLLSGLGALTAVLLLIFQDTIKGLVASIQISANKMVAPGDWIQMPKYGADGDVLEIGLNTVKVQNFDRTVTTIPTYALISESFKNWRDMYHSGGRRIKRSISIDVNSIAFASDEQLAQWQRLKLLKPYLEIKKSQIDRVNKAINPDDINARRLSNIGVFRAYLEAYLDNHAQVNGLMTCMVRQLPVTEHGLPLELYFFSNEKEWIAYEGIQADIFDHVLVMAPFFGLRLYQQPAGFDWRVNQNH